MKLDKEMEKRIQQMALRTWDAIGGDALNALEQEGMEPIMKRLDVVQMIMDYLYQYGRDKEAYEAWKQLPDYESKEAALLPAFLFKTYGW